MAPGRCTCRHQGHLSEGGGDILAPHDPREALVLVRKAAAEVDGRFAAHRRRVLSCIFRVWCDGFGFVGRAAFESEAVVSGLDDVAVVGQTVEQRGRHLGIAEGARPSELRLVVMEAYLPRSESKHARAGPLFRHAGYRQVMFYSARHPVADHVGRLFGNHYHWGSCVARHDLRHDRGVDHAQAG